MLDCDSGCRHSASTLLASGSNRDERARKSAVSRGKLLACNSMARPRVHHEKRVTTAIRVPEDLHGQLARAAEERDLSVNYLVVRAIEDFLDRLIPAEEMKLTRS